MNTVNEMKSGNVLTKALSPAKTMAKGKARGAIQSRAPRAQARPRETQSVNPLVRYGEHR